MGKHRSHFLARGKQSHPLWRFDDAGPAQLHVNADLEFTNFGDRILNNFWFFWPSPLFAPFCHNPLEIHRITRLVGIFDSEGSSGHQVSH